jgi:hypothetical protein
MCRERTNERTNEARELKDSSGCFTLESCRIHANGPSDDPALRPAEIIIPGHEGIRELPFYRAA